MMKQLKVENEKLKMASLVTVPGNPVKTLSQPTQMK
jgi:hypothetical protein